MSNHPNCRSSALLALTFVSLFGAVTARANSYSQGSTPSPSVFAVAAGGNGTGGFVQGGETVFVDGSNPGGFGEFRAGGYDEQLAASGSVAATHTFSDIYNI